MLNDAVEACAATPAASGNFKREICFTDPLIETSDVLERFLHFMMKGELAKWDDTFKECEALCRTVAFMRKYECEFILSFFKRYLRDRHKSKTFAPFYIFMLAAALDDVELSIAAFRRANGPATIKWPAYKRDHGIPGVNDSTTPTDILNLRPDNGDNIWPYDLWPHIPADYLWAANKAWSMKWAARVADDAADAVRDAGQRRTGTPITRSPQFAKRQRPLPIVEVSHIPLDKSSWNSEELVQSTAGALNVDIASEYEAAIKAVKKQAGVGNAKRS